VPECLQGIIHCEGGFPVADKKQDDDSGDGGGDVSSTTQQTITVTVTRVVTVTTPPPSCNWLCKIKGWVVKHREVVSFVTEIVVGATCVGTAAAAGVGTGGAGFALAAGCGAIAGAAGSAVDNTLDPDADHSALGTLKAEAGGAVEGAVSGAVGAGVGHVLGKGIEKAASKLLGNKAAKAARAASGEGGGGGGGGVTCHSFLPGTQVLLADGTHKAIEDVRPEDVVLTTDADTGKTTAKPVAPWVPEQERGWGDRNRACGSCTDENLQVLGARHKGGREWSPIPHCPCSRYLGLARNRPATIRRPELL
jgi:hypothetical protein